MSHQQAEAPHLQLVPDALVGQQDAGCATIMGPFPPLINAASAHASGMLQLFKSSGFKVRSATGPGLALARHQINFTSETRLRESTAFLDECASDDVAVIYARTLEFARVTRPYWYKRRLEELRRLRFLWRVVTTFEKTAVVYDRAPAVSRTQISIWAVAKIAALWSRKKIWSVGHKAKSEEAFEALTGLQKSPPSAYVAENTAYEAAFDSTHDAAKIRLTSARVEQMVQFWASRNRSEASDALLHDVRELVEVVRRHDLQHLSQFRMLWNTQHDEGRDIRWRERSRAIEVALSRPNDESSSVPVTRYMRHLSDIHQPLEDGQFRAQRADRKLLDWYMTEASSNVAANWVPVNEAMLRVLQQGADLRPPYPEHGADVAHTLGRTARPFLLSPALAEIARDLSTRSDRFDVDDPLDRIGFAFEVLLRSGSDITGVNLLGADAVRYFSAPLGGLAGHVTRLDLLLAMQARFELEDRSSIEKPWISDVLRRWVSNYAAQVFPGVAALLPKPKPIKPSERAFVLSGLPKSETGVGSNLHMSVAAFQHLGLNPEVRDTADQMRETGTSAGHTPGRRLKRSFAFHHVNADQIPQVVTSPSFAVDPEMMQVGFLLWEFDVLPKSHRLALDMLDEIWTPSTFLRDVYARESSKPVHSVFKGLHIPEVEAFDLSGFGVRDGDMTFLTCFDFHSSVARKNPLAAVRAFQAAFPRRLTHARMIVKTTPTVANHWGDPEGQMRQIMQIAARDPRIVVLAEYVPFNQLLGLIKACDCLVSPHRAEGFGLMPAYALGLGKPVMATDYSGTVDFCTEATSFPISYQLRAVEPHQVIHPLSGASWAEINVDALAAEMARLEASNSEAIGRAAQGEALIRAQFSPQAQAARYLERLTDAGIL